MSELDDALKCLRYERGEKEALLERVGEMEMEIVGYKTTLAGLRTELHSANIDAANMLAENTDLRTERKAFVKLIQAIGIAEETLQAYGIDL